LSIEKKNLDSSLGDSMIKASNSFITAKGSMPLLHKIIKPTSTKHKVDNQDESDAIKGLKTFHISSEDKIK
jgi:hypothetical protein